VLNRELQSYQYVVVPPTGTSPTNVTSIYADCSTCYVGDSTNFFATTIPPGEEITWRMNSIPVTLPYTPTQPGTLSVKACPVKDPKLLADLEELVAPTTLGDPESPLRWTCKSVRELAEELNGTSATADKNLQPRLFLKKISLKMI